jgi:hypothetical protein
MKHTLALVLIVLGFVGCAGLDELVNPSTEIRTARIQGYNDYKLCQLYFDTFTGSGRSDEFRYPGYVEIIKEVEVREINCRKFPELSKKKDFIREWVKEYEKRI